MNFYNPKHTGFLELGLSPHFLTGEVLAEMMERVLKHKKSIQEYRISKEAKWA